MNEMIPTKFKFDGLKTKCFEILSFVPIVLCFLGWLALVIGFFMEASKFVELQQGLPR
ncbi:MAG: hypothetical protein AB7F66_09170 [Bacteriovoracia bacterium]